VIIVDAMAVRLEMQQGKKSRPLDRVLSTPIAVAQMKIAQIVVQSFVLQSVPRGLDVTIRQPNADNVW